MEKLSAAQLSADYKVECKYLIQSEENNHCSSFECNIRLQAIYFEEEEAYYHFTIQRTDVLLNGKEASKLMDKVVCEMGDTLYPLILKVSPLLEILDVFNFEEIKLRRQNKAEEITEKYSEPVIEQYISRSDKKFVDKRAFIQALYQDSFFNLYFRDIYAKMSDDEAGAILWVNFPKRELNRTYLYQINADNLQIKTMGEVMKITPESAGEYAMTYTVGEYGEIHTINGEITSLYGTKDYIKQISVNQSKLKTSTTKWESIIL
jgi:hypothetical protein